MKEPHEVRPSQSPRPRVMRVGGQPSERSVHRGTTRPCIELRKHLFCGGRPFRVTGKPTVKSNDQGEFGDTPTESETTRMAGNFPHGSRETQAASASHEADRSEKARRHKSDMYAAGESDSSIVPKKPANKDGPIASAESAEGRGLTEENAGQLLLGRTQGRKPRSRGLFGVREAAERDKTMRFNNLLHHLTPEFLRMSFFDLKKQAAPGIDGVTWAKYVEGLDARIDDLRTSESIAGRIGRSRPSGGGFPSSTASCVRWESPRWKTKSSSRPRGQCSNASTNRTFWGSVTAIGLAEAVTAPWTHCT